MSTRKDARYQHALIIVLMIAGFTASFWGIRTVDRYETALEERDAALFERDEALEKFNRTRVLCHSFNKNRLPNGELSSEWCVMTWSEVEAPICDINYYKDVPPCPKECWEYLD